MSCKSGKPIQEVAQEGPGLVFVVYPEALATMPGASVFSVIFFLMLLTLGLDSSFGGSEAIITALGDEFPLLNRRREYFVAILFAFYMFIGIGICTECTIISCFANYEPLKYQDFVYPQMANIIGILFSLSTISVIFIVGIYKLFTAKGDTFSMKLKAVLMPHRQNHIGSNEMTGSMSNDEINL
ncbi:unnamed protein product [Acanthocheilonema viteae]|uniref:Uncharacterized protein n=1 Tax=Acanthocheilonema viteae TaxID=6277 RepID=A0A498S9Y1_ACAVI|nr:unnamed protein product [Acanthocheilonema viteae]